MIWATEPWKTLTQKLLDLGKRLFVIGTRDDQRQTYTLPRPLVERPLTVRDAIGNLPPLGVNDGKEELVLRKLPPRTLYQSWVQGEIGVEDLIQVLSGEPGASQDGWGGDMR